MKIRTDFVTNSSSSSFILAFTSKDTIADELYRGFPKEQLSYFGRVIDDVLDAEQMPKQECIEAIRDSLWYEIRNQVINDYIVDNNDGIHNHRGKLDAVSYVDSCEGQEEFNLRLNNEMAEYESELDGKDYIVRIEYCDHDYPDCDLEHGVMWEVGSVVRGISEH